MLKIQRANEILERMKRKYPVEVSQNLLRLPRVAVDMLSNETAVQGWADNLKELLVEGGHATAEVAVEHDPEHQE